MPDNSAVKSTARVSLRNLWPQAIAVASILLAAVFIVVVICSVNSLAFGTFAKYVNIAAAVLLFFTVLAPLILGVLRWFWRATAGKADQVTSVFRYFGKDKYRRAFIFAFMYVTKNALIAGVSLLPFFAVTIASKLPLDMISVHSGELYLGLIGVLLGVLGTVVFLLLSTKYYIAPMIFVCCEDKHWTEVFYLSKRVAQYSSGAFLVLVAGMLGWMLLSFFGVTMIYTLPYMLAAFAVHCRYSFHYYNHNMNILQENGFSEYRSEF